MERATIITTPSTSLSVIVVDGVWNPSSPNPQGGGGYSISSSYVGSGPASTVHAQKYQEFQAP